MIDPTTVPTKTLANGDLIPAIGIGTFGSDRYSASDIASALEGAIQYGYRHVDCASVYGNEREIGGALAKVIGAGVPREDLWVTSKVWNNRHEDAVASCEDTLRDLQLDYLDMYLIHWPFPNHHSVGVDVGSRDPYAVPYVHESYMNTWRQLESLVERGLVRHIGTSNMTIPKLELLLQDAFIRPSANQLELHPHFQQPDLLAYLLQKGIQPVGYSPFGSPSRPERDRTPEDTVDLEDPAILDIAANRGLLPAQVAIKWAIQRGHIPIPFSVKASQYESSLNAAVGEPLSTSEMTALGEIDRGCRLIKGQVFLWPTADGWEDLWDEEGMVVTA